MSNRLNAKENSTSYTSVQALALIQKPKGKRRIIGTPDQKSNGFRLSDIRKVIHGRNNGGPCEDRKWSKIYFRAALPHIIADHGRIVAAKGSYVDAVSAWIDEFVPYLLWYEKAGWLEEQVGACLAKPPRERCPRIDRTSRIMRIKDDEPVAFDLCSLPAMSRPKKVRKVQRAAEAVARSQRNRAKKPGYKPRSESLEQTQPWKAEGISRTEWYDRRKREREAASVAVLDEPRHTEAELLDSFVRRDSGTLDNSVRDRSDGLSGQFRSQHLEYPTAPITALRIKAPEYVPFPLPTPEQHASTMAALHAGADAAWAEFGIVSGF